MFVNTQVYIMSDKGPKTGRKKRGAPTPYGVSAKNSFLDIEFRVFRCVYKNCLPPPPPTLPPGRPLDFKKWSDSSAWLEIGVSVPRHGDTVRWVLSPSQL